LIITVMILALLAIMAVAFLLSSRVERGTARGVADKVKADLAAQSAINAAIIRLIDNLTNYPDSATTWESVNGVNPGTILYFRDKTPELAIPAGSHANSSKLKVLPLISGGIITDGDATSKKSSLPILNQNNSYNLNHSRFFGDTQGWIGAPPGFATLPEYRGQWIGVTDSSGKTTARYAYWVEDESFKVNTNMMGSNLRLGNTLGDDPKQIPLQGMLATIGLSSSDYSNIAQDIFDFRSLFPSSLFFEYRSLNQTKKNKAATFDFSTLAESAKFIATIYSGSLDLSRSGSKRVNLNKIVTSSTNATVIRTQLNQIIKTITYHLPNFGQRFYRATTITTANYQTALNTLDVPDSSSAPMRTVYLNRLAANIRDYIDNDSQPTIINNDPPTCSVRIGSAPTNALRATGGSGGTSGPNEVMAIGKERVPTMQEYALRVRQLQFSAKTGTSADYKIAIDHYFEFWNTSNRDILVDDLGTDPFLLIANEPGWDGGTLDSIPEGGGPPLRDRKLLLKSAASAANGSPLKSFPAGSVTVLTTDPVPLNSLTPTKANLFLFPTPTPSATYNYGGSGKTDLRNYSGTTNKKNANDYLRLNILPRTTTNTDYETEIVLGNSLGILESAWGGAPMTAQLSINVDDGSAPTGSGSQKFDDAKYHFRGGSLNGNITNPAPNATTGDPRTNADQMRFDLNGASANNDKTRYFSSSLNDNNIPASSSLGAPNSVYVNPAIWIDYSSNSQSASNAPSIVADAALISIGQLGDIFDPVRAKGDATGTDSDGVPLNIKLSRSGGRTLRVGQPERYNANVDSDTSRKINDAGLWDGDSNSASKEWTAWRLTDVFTTSNSVQLDGRVNINGVNRDYVDAAHPGGGALKTALYGYNFQTTPDSDPNLAGKQFDADPSNATDKVNELIKQMQSRVSNDQAAYSAAFKNTSGPFAERGEVSELPLFNTGKDLNSGVITGNAYDRGREELFRRLVELTTTRGNIFSVYAAGQSLVPQSDPTKPIVTSTSQLKVTFRIDPVWNAAPQPDPNWDPTKTTEVTQRFRKPDKYAIKILYAGE
jgi:hypothetical protein